MQKFTSLSKRFESGVNKVLTSSGYQYIFNVTTNKQCFRIVAASKFDAIYITKKFFPAENIISLI